MKRSHAIHICRDLCLYWPTEFCDESPNFSRTGVPWLIFCGTQRRNCDLAPTCHAEQNANDECERQRSQQFHCSRAHDNASRGAEEAVDMLRRPEISGRFNAVDVRHATHKKPHRQPVQVCTQGQDGGYTRHQIHQLRQDRHVLSQLYRILLFARCRCTNW